MRRGRGARARRGGGGRSGQGGGFVRGRGPIQFNPSSGGRRGNRRVRICSLSLVSSYSIHSVSISTVP